MLWLSVVFFHIITSLGIIMFVRVKKNKSGSTSVIIVKGERVPGKLHPQLRTVKNFGAGNSTEEIKQLKLLATTYMKQALKENPTSANLSISCDADIKTCSSYNFGATTILGQVFSEAFGNLKLDSSQLSMLANIVSIRITEPASKLHTSKTADQYGINLPVHKIYRLMDKIDAKLTDQIKNLSFKTTTHLLSLEKKSVDVLFYDLTTIAFETNTNDDLREKGFSKDGKSQHVQIVLAMMVTTDGLPVGYEYFKGNSSEVSTLIPAIDKLKKSYNISKIVIVADSALMSKVNLSNLEEKNYEYVISAKVKNMDKEKTNKILNQESYKLLKETVTKDGEVLDSISSYEIKLTNERRLILYHSTQRARKDAHERGKDIERIEKYLGTESKGKLTKILNKPYVEFTDKEKARIEINKEKLEEVSRFDGIFGIVTNVKEISHRDLLAQYRGLWQIEESFRICKYNLEIRPVYHKVQKRIESHLMICYMAFCTLRYVMYKTKRGGVEVTIEELISTLKGMRKVRIEDAKGKKFEILEKLPEKAVSICKALGIKATRKFEVLAA